MTRQLARSDKTTTAGVESLIAARRLRAAFQPIVDLQTGRTVAYEALARGPLGHPLERPDALFDAARAAGCVGALDAECRRTAVGEARRAGLRAPWTLFVNVEPAGLDWYFATRDPVGQQPAARVTPELPVMIEITERDLTADPFALLQLVKHARSLGCGIALDDVGAEQASLALLPLLQPDVIKLDLRLVQQRPSADVAEIFSAVTAEAERSGAVILAEGIETTEHRDFARGLGAQLGQGWLLGRPGPLSDLLPDAPARSVLNQSRTLIPQHSTPFDVVRGWSHTQVVTKPLLVEVSKMLERQAAQLGGTGVIASTLQHARFVTPATGRRYEALGAQVALAALLGEGLPAHPLTNVMGGNLHASDPMTGEWDVAVLGPHFAAALIARDLGDTGPDEQRRFEYVLTHNRSLVVAAMTALLSRVRP